MRSWDGPIRRGSDRRGLSMLIVAALIVALVLLIVLIGRQRSTRTASIVPPREPVVIADDVPVSLASALAVGARSVASSGSVAIQTAAASAMVTATVSRTTTVAATGPGTGAQAAYSLAGGALLTAAPSATELLRHAAELEAELRTGEFQITIDYGNARRALVTVRFDRGDRDRARRVQIINDTEGPEGRDMREQIAIGGKAWERRPGGPWTVATSQESLWEQVEAYLPHSGAIANPLLARAPGVMILRYNDAGRDANTALTFDLASGLPKELHQVTRAGVVVRVLYRGWNTPVDIREP